MTKLMRGLAMFAALLAAGLIAAPALAEKPAQKKAGVLHVYGNADTKLFSENGIKQAESILQGTQFDHGLVVTVDTYTEVPANKRAEADAAKGSEESWHRFLEKWTKERASSDKSRGIYIVIVQKPIGGIAVVADRESRERGFSDADEKHVWETIRTSFREASKQGDEGKKREARDSGLIATMDFVVNDLKDTHVAVSASTKSDTKKTGGMGVGGWICLGLCILLGVWLVIGIIRALTAPAGGYGPGGGYGGGGGGFGSSLLGGLFGAMAGMWLYNSMFGGHHDMGSNDAFANDGGGASDADTGAGDYGGEDGAAGGYDSGGDGGGGDWGGGGGDWGGGGDFGGDF
jgi:uncharacterized protein